MAPFPEVGTVKKKEDVQDIIDDPRFVELLSTSGPTQPPSQVLDPESLRDRVEGSRDRDGNPLVTIRPPKSVWKEAKEDEKKKKRDAEYRSAMMAIHETEHQTPEDKEECIRDWHDILRKGKGSTDTTYLSDGKHVYGYGMKSGDRRWSLELYRSLVDQMLSIYPRGRHERRDLKRTAKEIIAKTGKNFASGFVGSLVRRLLYVRMLARKERISRPPAQDWSVYSPSQIWTIVGDMDEFDMKYVMDSLDVPESRRSSINQFVGKLIRQLGFDRKKWKRQGKSGWIYIPGPKLLLMRSTMVGRADGSSAPFADVLHGTSLPVPASCKPCDGNRYLSRTEFSSGPYVSVWSASRNHPPSGGMAYPSRTGTGCWRPRVVPASSVDVTRSLASSA